MKVIVIIDCADCQTRQEHELHEGTNIVPSCGCPYPHGDDGGTVVVTTEKG
jgi:hypothetical protein